MNDNQEPVLICKDLCISYYTRAGEIPAVVDFSLTVKPGETIGIVGESGCGKSTVAMAIMQYMGANGGIKSGSITFKGQDLTTLNENELRRIRGSEISMIYQEPFASLNPSLKISTQLMEVPLAHEDISKEEARKRSIQMLKDVNLPDPERVMASYPE
jgi:peptide/nickel transport system ATP-binding protein